MKLYVGTYAKYNNGDLFGAWLDLDRFANAGRPEVVVRILNDEDMRRMRREYMAVRRDFRRRVNAYWKRFGASKIHTWTYWTEA